jgi:hypothetical protein
MMVKILRGRVAIFKFIEIFTVKIIELHTDLFEITTFFMRTVCTFNLQSDRSRKINPSRVQKRKFTLFLFSRICETQII